MKIGGISTSSGAQTVLRWTTLLAPQFIAAYTYLTSRGILGTTFGYTTGQDLADIFSLAWVAFGVIFFVTFSPKLWNAGIRLGMFHVLGGLYIALFMGFAFPITTLWLALVLACYGYFGMLGVSSSLAVMVGVALLDSVLHENTLGPNVAMTIAIIIMSIMIVLLMRVQERDEVEFAKSQRTASLQQESLVTLINNLTDAVLSTDTKGHIRLFNAATIGLLDTNVSLTGKTIDSVLELQDEHGARAKLLPMLKASESVKIDDSLRLANTDEEVRLEIIYAPIKNSYSLRTSGAEESGYMIILRDVTKAKSLEEERDEFISVVSHELRTPIAISEGALDNAKLIFNKDARKKTLVKKSLDTAYEQIVFLSKMINDLSTLSRAERGVADEPETIDVDTLAHSLYDEYSPEAEKKGLRLNLSLHGKLGNVRASKLYLHELLQNFITNSIKYTKEGSVTIEITRADGHVMFAVRDTGIGISKADQARIFEKFYRSEDYRTRETGGTGLGLHVAKKLSRKLGTEIQVDSRLNHGSTFSFMLPAVKDNIDENSEVQ